MPGEVRIQSSAILANLGNMYVSMGPHFSAQYSRACHVLVTPVFVLHIGFFQPDGSAYDTQHTYSLTSDTLPVGKLLRLYIGSSVRYRGSWGTYYLIEKGVVKR